jgi:hypothetical protein
MTLSAQPEGLTSGSGSAFDSTSRARPAFPALGDGLDVVRACEQARMSEVLLKAHESCFLAQSRGADELSPLPTTPVRSVASPGPGQSPGGIRLTRPAHPPGRGLRDREGCASRGLAGPSGGV